MFFGVITASKKLPCNHIFHTSCLRSWFQRQQTCPTCRLNILRVPAPNTQNPATPQGAQAPGQQPHGPHVAVLPPPPGEWSKSLKEKILQFPPLDLVIDSFNLFSIKLGDCHLFAKARVWYLTESGLGQWRMWREVLVSVTPKCHSVSN